MMHRFSRNAVPLLYVAAFAVVLAAACSSSIEFIGEGASGASAAAGASGAAGAGATTEPDASAGTSGHAGALGNDGGAADASEDANDCVHTGPPVINPAVFPTCAFCDNAHCVPSSFLPASQADLMADCNGTSKCVPDLFIETGGNFLLASCRSVGDVEGRCLSACLPLVQEQAEALPQDTCAVGERCVPCYDPTTAAQTGVCSLSCDPGPTEPPVTLSTCCGGIGTCLPASLIPPGQQALLGQDTCEEPATLCAPSALLDPTAKPPTCRSIANAEGRCMAACLPSVAVMASLLPQDSCADEHLCVPCYDPTTAQETGACSMNGDTPTEPPITFEACCGGIGSCLPASLVPPAQQSLLSGDTCSGAGDLCAPDELLDPAQVPDECASVGDVEGRCLPACLPAIAAQPLLSQSTCAATHRCAPCYDPFTGAPTGSCSLNGDAPTQSPSTFPTCCPTAGADRGTCVPESLLPAGQASSLTPQQCAPTWACVPTDKALDSTWKFPTCNAGLLGAGACLPSCFVNSPLAFLFQQGSCGTGERCVPCSVLGASTGACD